MAEYKEHCKDCLMALGEEYGRVHRYLDEFCFTKGPTHRAIRHHTGGVEEVRKKWGNGAARAAEIHIARDWHSFRIAGFTGGVPTKEQAVALSSCLL